MRTKEYLLRVKVCDTHINNLMEELETLKEMVTKVTSTMKDSAVSGGGNKDKIGNAVAKIVDLQREINEAIDEYVDKKREVMATIEKVEDANQLAVLHKRYIQYKPWEQIACEMNFTYRNVCYIHGRALQKVSDLIKGETEE